MNLIMGLFLYIVCYIYMYMYSAMMRGVQNIHWMRYDCCYRWQHSW